MTHPTRTRHPLLRVLLVVPFLVASAGCGRTGGAEGDVNGQAATGEVAEHEHGGAEAITIWTDSVELFFEHPPLLAGERSEPWAVHVTTLRDFQPVEEGTLTVLFERPGGRAHTFVEESPASPGIYSPTPMVPDAGIYDLVIRIEGPRVEAEVFVGPIEVYASVESIPEIGEHTHAGISFLKEQQWQVPFATASAERREVARTVSAPGEIVPTARRFAEVAAPVEGLALPDANRAAPVPGDWVERGRALAVLSPVGGEGSYAAQRARYERLERELARARRLYEVEAIPERRLEAARHEFEVARATLEAMGGESSGSDDGYRFTLRAPISGVVAERELAIGARVAAGTRVFTIVDPREVWLRARVPAAAASRIQRAERATFTVEDDTRVYRADRAVSVGSVIDPETRTIPVLFAVDNPDRSLKIGMLADARVLLPEGADGVAIPNAAVRNEDGLAVAYVQTGGESFERRVLTLGPSDGEWTVVDEGVGPGERVVTEGAYQVRLASLNTSDAAGHGHPH